MNRFAQGIVLGCLLGMLCPAGGRAAWGQETWEKDGMEALRAYRALNDQGKYAEALPHAKRFVELAREIHGEDDRRYAMAQGKLAELYKAMGNHAKAESIYVEALARARKQLKPRDPKLAEALNDLAGVYKLMGQHGKVEHFRIG